jgi:7-cyano-7-deazaguanine synthase
MDSTALAALLASFGFEVHGLGVDYGQRHRFELERAEEIAVALGVSFRVADLSGIRPLLAGSSQTSDDIEVPEGHYTDESMKATVVPNRNMLLIALAGAYAQSIGAQAVAYAAHAGDHPIYPDCRPEFADAADEALALGSGLKLIRPFVLFDKAAIARIGHVLGAPMHLTWSCYKGDGVAHCGKCGTCVERREAFEFAGVPDPTVWA